MITLIGTGHVFNIGPRVREEIRRRAPQVVGIELDPPRYHALRNKTQDRKGLPLAYRILSDFQTRLANEYGVEAGDEMLAASEEARVLGVPLALIDADAQQTFARLRKEMRFREKTRLVGSIVGSLFVRGGKTVEKQVEEMQEDYTVFFAQMGEKFPTVKRILIDERNAHMAGALVEMAKTNERIVAVVGDGHVDGMLAILAAQGLQADAVRLKELRAAPAAPVGNASATLSMDISGESPPPRGPPP